MGVSDTYIGWTYSRHAFTVRSMDPGKKVLRKFGKRVRELRLERGLSQEEFALEANIARSYMGDIERGQRNVSLINMARIAGALQVSLSELCNSIPGIQPD